jgi:hypothetical protein
MDRACNTKGAQRIAYRLLVRKPEGKRLLERPKRICAVNIKMDFGEIEWAGMGWLRIRTRVGLL